MQRRLAASGPLPPFKFAALPTLSRRGGRPLNPASAPLHMGCARRHRVHIKRCLAASGR